MKESVLLPIWRATPKTPFNTIFLLEEKHEHTSKSRVKNTFISHLHSSFTLCTKQNTTGSKDKWFQKSKFFNGHCMTLANISCIYCMSMCFDGPCISLLTLTFLSNMWPWPTPFYLSYICIDVLCIDGLRIWSCANLELCPLAMWIHPPRYPGGTKPSRRQRRMYSNPFLCHLPFLLKSSPVAHWFFFCLFPPCILAPSQRLRPHSYVTGWI